MDFCEQIPMKVYLIIQSGGDMFETNWERPVEIFSAKESVDERCRKLNQESIERALEYGFKYVEFELDKTHEHF
jgi:hypothetical protein